MALHCAECGSTDVNCCAGDVVCCTSCGHTGNHRGIDADAPQPKVTKTAVPKRKKADGK